MSKRSADLTSTSPSSSPMIKSRKSNEVGSPSPASSSPLSSSAASPVVFIPREAEWVSCSGDVITVNERMLEGVGPRQILQQLVPDVTIDDQVDDSVIWQIIVNMLTELPRRSKLPQYNTMDDAVQLLRTCSKIIILTGAGVSVSCGIPDFRSRNGIYARLRKDFPDLPNPEAMFDLEYFRKNPKPFYEFAREIFPGQYRPSLSHRFVKELENHGKMLRNYTQNIDVLENIAGIQNVIQCHGSFATASCCACKYKVNCDAVKDAIFEKSIPRCPKCPPDAEFNVMKPDIVFFGEDLPGEFHDRFQADKEEVDLLIVIGSSLKVRPVALVPNSIPRNVPQILINREPLQHMEFDIELLGNCDTIISELCHRLGGVWAALASGHQPLREAAFVESSAPKSDTKISTKPRSSQPSSPKAAKPEMKRRNTTDITSVGSDGGDGNAQQDVELERLRKMYKPRLRNLANELEDNTYLFVPPNRYVFSGAEVFAPWADDDDSSSSSSSTSGASSDDEPLEETKQHSHGEEVI